MTTGFSTIVAQRHPETALNWRHLRMFNVFRLCLAATLLASSLLAKDAFIATAHNPALFHYASLAFLLFSVISIGAIRWQRPAFTLQIYLYAFVDIIAITLLTHAMGDFGSGLGMLLVITIAGTALLAPERGSKMIAAIATIAILGENAFTHLAEGITPNYTQSGIMGATFFATALLTNVLSRRLHESEQLAEQRGIDLANMAQLNEHVIQLLQSGVIVVDKQRNIRLINHAAARLLGLPHNISRSRLEEAAPELFLPYQEWIRQRDQPRQSVHLSESRMDVLPRFSALGDDPGAGTLILLEDSSELAQQAQQLKLASLGQLTASIAHEVRNPLGAISHAAQLLEESPDLHLQDKRLIEIIGKHSQRVNRIIENVLQLSRRDTFHPTAIALKPWLDDFITELSESNRIDRGEIALHDKARNPTILMDNSQLHQVLWNLCQNGLRHSRDYPGSPKLELVIGSSDDTDRPYLDVIDHGPGIRPEVAEHIFEPFYTTESGGTGLGLYIARELCECNRARLEYLPVAEGGSCFRITFSHLSAPKNQPQTAVP
ncbi:MAG: ATP-binding protein [Pseudomonadota bacterium]